MKVFNKCLLLFIFLMFFVGGDVKAISFSKDGGYIKFLNKGLEYKGLVSSKPSSNFNYTYYKTVVGSDVAAYCAQHSNDSPNKSTVYTRDTGYDTSTQCKRISNSSSADCSSMVGFIIKAGDNLGYGDSAKEYFYIQLAIQNYFYNYSDVMRYKEGNEGELVRNAGNNSVVKGILSAADTMYGTANSSNSRLPEASDIFKGSNDFSIYISSVGISVGSSDRYTKMYYNTTSGYYVSYYLKINGPSVIGTSKVEYYISGDDAYNVKICKVGSNGNDDCGTGITIGVGEEFYVKTSSSASNVKLSVKASVEVESNDGAIRCDSVRYNTNSKQDMIVSAGCTNSSNSKGTVSYVKNIYFYPQQVNQSTCSKWVGLSDDTKKTGGVTKGEQCVSNKCSDVADKEKCIADSSPTAEFSGCSSSNISVDYYVKVGSTCTSMKASVGVLLLEKGSFVYSGIVSEQTPLYVGGGFELLNNNNLYTYYKNSFSYNYKYVYANNPNKLYVYYGNKYFVDDDTYVYDNASCVGTSVKASNYFVNKLLSGVALSSSINDLTSKFKEMFKSLDTNKESKEDYVDVVEVSFKDGYSYNEVIKKNGWLPGTINERTVIYTFNLKKAFDNLKTGEIVYNNDLIDDINYVLLDKDKNKYYTYIKYQGDKYPFNVYNTNFRATNYVSYQWIVESECDIDMGNKIFECEDNKCNILARYRSVDVNKPFPKATTYDDVPFNWRMWYYDSSNKVRLKNTYNQYIYKLELNNNNISKISADKNYTSWQNMLSNGSSQFINKDFSAYFSNKVSGNSYCELGKFSSECDK